MSLRALKFPGLGKDTTQTTFLIEQTGKQWKALTLLALFLGMLGISLLCWQVWDSVYKPLINSGFNPGISPLKGFDTFLTSMSGVFGVLFCLISVVIGFYARFMAWWRHG